ncbi:MAG: sigma-54-dependent Fis family transcriptional regulator [Desulfobacteraceae bacterium]|nr:sigma-54-dependent Fis family transcriptional regulator [Desulfobacteraceae bacterium]
MNADIKKRKSLPSIMIVDDDLKILEVLDARLSSAGFKILKAAGATQALKTLESESVDLMISDMKMPDMGGMELLEKARATLPNLPVIFITAYGNIPDAVKAVKAGAVDYLAKPFEGQQLLKKIRATLKKAGVVNSQIYASPVIDDIKNAKSDNMLKLYDIVKKVAPSNVSVLILGESGVGKERIARLIHELGPRKTKPFVVVDCGSTPAGLLESELFGHIRGSFTHAVNDKTGLIQTADTGTLFLDEIGNISPEMQIRLLRFIEDRKIRRIGDIKENPVDCRIIAATNADLIEDIKNGRFREDLYYRLRVVTLNIPRLKDRKEDIPLLARQFVADACEMQGIEQVELPQKTLDWLCEYPWPGNIRELKNAVEAGIVLCRDSVLKPGDLHLIGLPEMPESNNPVDADDTFSLEETERLVILRALKKTGGVQKEAAELLGISRRAIHYKIKKYSIDSSLMRRQ